MKLADVKIYRMTHIANLPHILQHGITHKNSPNCNPNFVPIGDVSLINTRENKRVSVDNGDFSDYSAPVVTLGAFIPFYLGVRMPMLFVAQNGGNAVERATSPKDIIYLVCSVSEIAKAQDTFYFTDGHATDGYTTFYDATKLTNLPEIVDWDAVKASYWAGGENLNIKRKKQAEFLAATDISPHLIVGFGCYNEAAKVQLLQYGVPENKIKIIPNAYY